MVTGPIRCVALVCAASLAALPQAAASDAFITGDSLGQGIAAAAGLPNRAQLSVRLARSEPIRQMAALPRGSLVYMSLGTNDAVGPVDRLGPSVDRIVAAARERQLRLVWIGPPCTQSRRVPNVVALDALLRGRVRGPGITYVSAVEGTHCDAEMRARDGIHFTARGYRALWELARAAVERPPGGPAAPAAVALAQPAPRPGVTPVAAVAATAPEPPSADRHARPPAEPAVAHGRPMRLLPVVLTVPAPQPIPAPPAPRPPSFWPFSGS
jgi:hypothetical protein